MNLGGQLSSLARQRLKVGVLSTVSMHTYDICLIIRNWSIFKALKQSLHLTGCTCTHWYYPEAPVQQMGKVGLFREKMHRLVKVITYKAVAPRAGHPLGSCR